MVRPSGVRECRTERPSRRVWTRSASRSAFACSDAEAALIPVAAARSAVPHGSASETALLGYLSGHASGCRVLCVAGSQPDSELAFAGLHQLCAPLLSHLETLAGPQRDALLTAFGMRAGSPDQFLIGLAVLGLLSE